jgi:hypothetical protein
MKGLLITFLVMVILISGGAGASYVVYNNLNEKLATAHDEGYEQGHSEGYEQGFEEGGTAGYQAGSKEGLIEADWRNIEDINETGSYFLYNPTYNEVKEILDSSEANNADDIHKFAGVNGLRVAYVRIQIAREASEGMVYIYQLVAFETIDKGLIFIEPWSYNEVKIEAGKSYSELNDLPPRSYDDTITKITIIW